MGDKGLLNVCPSPATVVKAVMDFRLLGPLEVDLDGQPRLARRLSPRALLTLLLLHRNEVLALDRIVDEAMAKRRRRRPEQVVRVYVSQLRKALEPERLITRGSGYLLTTAPEEVDLDRFDSLRAEGRRLLAVGEAAPAAEALGQALSLWRGPPLQDVAYESFAQPEIARLEEIRLTTVEDRFDALLAVGQDSELVADLEQLVRANPLRERLRAQLMLALYRSGRHADALEAYQRGRRLLVDELGLEPSDTLRQLEMRILQQDPALDQPSASPYAATTPPPPTPRARARRKTARGVAVALLILAVAVGVLIAATSGSGRTKQDGPRHARRQPAARAKVSATPRGRATTRSTACAPRRTLFPSTRRLSTAARLQARFLKTVATAARMSGTS